MPERCVMYVDGYNFYYGIKHHPAETPSYLGWCDFRLLAERYMVPPGGELLSVKYFTAPVGVYGAQGGEAGSEEKRQAIWLRAARTIPGLEVLEGFHTGDRGRSANARALGRKEKETDVNIAVSMVVDAAQAGVDRVLLVTADRDQFPAVRAVAGTFGRKVDVWLSPNHVASQWQFLEALDRVTVKRITRRMLEDSRLQELLEDASGVFEAPKMWRAPRGPS